MSEPLKRAQLVATATVDVTSNDCNVPPACVLRAMCRSTAAPSLSWTLSMGLGQDQDGSLLPALRPQHLQ
jgi:hypothetical protein